MSIIIRPENFLVLTLMQNNFFFIVLVKFSSSYMKWEYIDVVMGDMGGGIKFNEKGRKF